MTADTIAAIATAPGRGGVGILRVSGPGVRNLAERLLGALPQARHAKAARFYRDAAAAEPEVLDHGIALFFPGPNSFTGEDVLELQGHGGPVVLDRLLSAALAAGSRLARPGEFSERAFLNGKIDLAQAEAIADLIDSRTEAAARSALRSLEGEFSRAVHALTDGLIELRVYIEAALDFPDDDIDFLADEGLAQKLQALRHSLSELQGRARQGQLLREGANLVIAGRPNAGKSSLLNRLSGRDSAIVTDRPGTTRDLLRESINLDGIPLQITDTAGLRNSDDPVEQEGIRRARTAIEQADLVLLVKDDSSDDSSDDDLLTHLKHLPRLTVLNKCDRSGRKPGLVDEHTLALSALTGAGLPELRQSLKQRLGASDSHESSFIARRRHLDALHRAAEHLEHGQQQLQHTRSGELLADDLRQAAQALGDITGQVSSDELLGHIFSSFCIGK